MEAGSEANREHIIIIILLLLLLYIRTPHTLYSKACILSVYRSAWARCSRKGSICYTCEAYPST